ncbi:hypothetical protein [Roseococcus sp.]
MRRFRVTGTEVVRWDASGIEPRQPGRRRVLATCWPPRDFVHAKMDGR